MTLAFKTLLNDSAEFRAIIKRAQRLSEVQQQLNRVLPAAFAPMVQVLSLEFGTLTVATGNATVAAKLRQLAPTIVSDLKNSGCEISGIRVKVQVSYMTPAPQRLPRQLSRNAQTAIETLSDTLTDSPLKNALKKVAAKQSR